MNQFNPEQSPIASYISSLASIRTSVEAHEYPAYIELFRRHRPLLLNWFMAKKQFSSGVVEGLTTKVKLTTRKSFGFRTFKATEIARIMRLERYPFRKLPRIFLTRLVYELPFICRY